MINVVLPSNRWVKPLRSLGFGPKMGHSGLTLGRWDDILIYDESYNMIYMNWQKRFRLIECDVFSCSSYGNDIVFCQVNQFYIQGHDMLIKPPAKPIDFRSLLIIYYSNDIYRSNQIVGTSIFSAQNRIILITMWPL